MPTQRLSPKAIPVLRALLAAHPEPVLKTELNAHIVPRLERNEPPMVRLCAQPEHWLAKRSVEPAVELTRYGLLVAKAIPANVPDEPATPIDVDISTGELVAPPDTTPQPPNGFGKPKDTPHPWRHYNGHGQPPPVLTRPTETEIHPAETNESAAEELRLIYAILPELRDYIRPLLDLKNRLSK